MQYYSSTLAKIHKGDQIEIKDLIKMVEKAHIAYTNKITEEPYAQQHIQIVKVHKLYHKHVSRSKMRDRLIFVLFFVEYTKIQKSLTFRCHLL